MSSEILERRMQIEAKKQAAQHTALLVSQECHDLSFDGLTLDDLDPSGTLLATVLALVPIARRTVGYDVTLLVSETRRWGLRIASHDPDPQITAVRIGGVESDPTSTTSTSSQPTPAPVGSVASELAALLRG